MHAVLISCPPWLGTPRGAPDPAPLDPMKGSIRQCNDRFDVAVAGSGHYARLQPSASFRGKRGTVRGTSRRIIPAQLVPSVRLPVPSVQLGRVQSVSTLLVNGRSAVRSRSPAPRSAGNWRRPARGMRNGPPRRSAPGRLPGRPRPSCSAAATKQPPPKRRSPRARCNGGRNWRPTLRPSTGPSHTSSRPPSTSARRGHQSATRRRNRKQSAHPNSRIPCPDSRRLPSQSLTVTVSAPHDWMSCRHGPTTQRLGLRRSEQGWTPVVSTPRGWSGRPAPSQRLTGRQKHPKRSRWSCSRSGRAGVARVLVDHLPGVHPVQVIGAEDDHDVGLPSLIRFIDW